MSDYNFTDSTNNSIKEAEYKKEINPNLYYNNINARKGEAYVENIKFSPKKNEKSWKIKMQSTFHFKHDIERVWCIIRNFDILSLISDQGHFPCVNIKGKDTWNVGNIFKGNLYKSFPFIARVEKMNNLPEMKEIKWLFKSIQDNIYFRIKINLYKVNDDNSTVLLKDTKFEKELTNLHDKIDDLKSNNIFASIDGILENEPISLLKYESGVIQGKMEDIYNILSDWSKITAIAPNNQVIPNVNLKDMNVGEKKQVSIFRNDGIQKIDITLKNLEINPGWNKWTIYFEISGGEPKKIPRHCFLIQLTKINNYECQIIILTKYFDAVNSQELNECNEKKKYLIMSLKDYFENFYFPESIN